MAQQIQLRNDSAAAWEAENPILAQAEVGVNTTTGQFKIGDGTSTWEELEYYAGGSANVADFVFDTLDGEGQESRITIHNHDMTIRTTRENAPEGEESIDADISLESADDVWIYANGDDIHLYAADDVEISTNWSNGSPGYNWEFTNSGRLKFPDGTYQTTSYQGITPPAYFLDWREGTAHLPDLNTHFGWNSNGLWFQNADESDGATSYPVFTDFTIPEDSSVVVEFIFDANTECNNIGVCVYSDGDNPEWDYTTNSSRIAAQFDCFDLKLFGRTTSAAGDVGIPESGLYRVRFAYNPTASTDKVTVSYTAQGSEEVIESLSINEALPAGPYRIGFAADQDSSSTKTYMTYVSIDVNDGDDNYGADLDTGNSGASDVDLVIPVAIKDDSGDDFITFTRTSTGTARIGTPQDDLSLRSARDITLFAGNEGPGNVYIGWGDAEYTPDSPNRVATIGDIQSAGTADFVFDTVEEPDYESTMTVTNNDMVIKTVVDTEASGNIRVESAQEIVFDANGDILLESKDNSDVVKASIRLDQSNEQVLIQAIASDSELFNDTQWSTAVWAGSVVTITNTPDIINFFNNVSGEVTRVSINDGGLITYEGASFGSGNMTLNVGGTPVAEEDPLTVTEIRFYYELVSEINIDHDDSEFNIISRGMSMTLDSSGELDLKARDSDLNLYANDDVRFTTNWDSNGTEHSWRMSETGKFELPGAGYIENPINSSGDGNGYDTIKIVPDSDLIEQQYHEDQYIIIDPTEPNHIHIRAGGIQDASTADLFLGAENTHVRVSDSVRSVDIEAKKDEDSWTYPNIDPAGGVVYVVDSDTAEPDYNDFMIVDGIRYVITSVVRDLGNSYYETTPSFTFAYNENYTFTRDNGSHRWRFGDEGDATLILPSENPTIANNAAPGDITLSAYNGIKLAFADVQGAGLEFPDNTVQNTAYIPGVDTTFTVAGGTLDEQPTFDGDPLFTGSYVRTGPMVHFRIDVDMDNITDFGTGQYYVDLPFPAKYNYLFRNACLHDVSAPRQYGLSGHVLAGESRVTLFYTETSGQDVAFDYNSPALLTINDSFHIAGDYIISDVA
jgi:hypothetical protein